MRALDLFASIDSVLCLGAHPDDVELGCGGTLLALRRARPAVRIELVVMTGDAVRAAEAAEAAERFCGPPVRPRTLGLRDSFLPYDGAAAKEALQAATVDLDPDIVFAHRRDDLHQDHRFVAELAAQLFRDHLILGYETPKSDGDLGPCNLYVPLTAGDASAKVTGIIEAFRSQRDKHWMRAETLEASLRLRGMEARAASGLAEGFLANKLVVR